MEDVLDLYHKPYNEQEPVICVDEANKQLTKETRMPITGKLKKYDYEYERNGTRNIFILFQPLGNYREVKITERRTATDWAHFMKDLVDSFPKSKTIHLVCDNLNTLNHGSLYKTFAPSIAREIAKRITLHYTPKHASWLNMAEIELSILSKQCLNRRIPDKYKLTSEIQAWVKNRNNKAETIKWQFTTDDARTSLIKLYPTL